MSEKHSYIYILANKRNGTIYVGVTAELKKRVYQHKEKLVEGFTKKYNIDKLMYFEQFNNIASAIEREKQIKSWSRKNKILLIEKNNPMWQDLYNEV
jgi:putative endonuclease